MATAQFQSPVPNGEHSPGEPAAQLWLSRFYPTRFSRFYRKRFHIAVRVATPFSGRLYERPKRCAPDKRNTMGHRIILKIVCSMVMILHMERATVCFWLFRPHCPPVSNWTKGAAFASCYQGLILFLLPMFQTPGVIPPISKWESE